MTVLYKGKLKRVFDTKKVPEMGPRKTNLREWAFFENVSQSSGESFLARSFTEKYVKEFSRSVKRSPLLTRRSLREIVKIARRS